MAKKSKGFQCILHILSAKTKTKKLKWKHFELWSFPTQRYVVPHYLVMPCEASYAVTRVLNRHSTVRCVTAVLDIVFTSIMSQELTIMGPPKCPGVHFGSQRRFWKQRDSPELTSDINTSQGVSISVVLQSL